MPTAPSMNLITITFDKIFRIKIRKQLKFLRSFHKISCSRSVYYSYISSTFKWLFNHKQSLHIYIYTHIITMFFVNNVMYAHPTTFYSYAKLCFNSDINKHKGIVNHSKQHFNCWFVKAQICGHCFIQNNINQNN